MARITKVILAITVAFTSVSITCTTAIACVWGGPTVLGSEDFTLVVRGQTLAVSTMRTPEVNLTFTLSTLGVALALCC